jgi:hypothetical protein
MQMGTPAAKSKPGLFSSRVGVAASNRAPEAISKSSFNSSARAHNGFFRLIRKCDGWYNRCALGNADKSDGKSSEKYLLYSYTLFVFGGEELNAV